ncbi:MerR family transcriptional regulator [Roseicella aquatilis]
MRLSAPIPLFDCPITFRFAAAAAGLPLVVLRKWIDRGQVTLEADAARPGGRGRRRFTPFDVVRLAVMARHFDAGAAVARIVAAREGIAPPGALPPAGASATPRRPCPPPPSSSTWPSPACWPSSPPPRCGR